MRKRVLRAKGWVVALGLAFGATPAVAEQYLVTVSAGANGDSHGGDNSDPDAFAEFTRTEAEGNEFYAASADTNGGSLLATASRAGTLPFLSYNPRSVARIEETIVFTQVPSGPITIQATLGVALEATANGGIAKAAAQLSLGGALGSCQTYLVQNTASGPDDLSTCNLVGSSAGAGTVTLVLTPEELAARLYQVDIDVQVEAGFELAFLNQIVSASASASGGTSPLGGRVVPLGGEPVAGILYIDIDPPLAHHYVGDLTSFPVLAPEPGAPLLAAGDAVLSVAGRRRRPGC